MPMPNATRSLFLFLSAFAFAFQRYMNMDYEYFKAYGKDYVGGPTAIIPEVAFENFLRPNLALPSINSNVSVTSIKGNGDATEILLDLSIDFAAAHTERGAPSMAQVRLQCSGDADDEVAYTLRWFNKTRSHAPETVWLSSIPTLLAVDTTAFTSSGSSARGSGAGGGGGGSNAATTVLVDKLGQDLNPEDADLGCDGQTRPTKTCGVHLHGVGDRGVSFTRSSSSSSINNTASGNNHGSGGGGGGGGRDDRGSTISCRRTLRMISVDSVLASVGTADPVPTPLRKPDIHKGLHWALVGNIWNTNYPFWYPFSEEDSASQFRFKLSFKSSLSCSV